MYTMQQFHLLNLSNIVIHLTSKIIKSSFRNLDEEDTKNKSFNQCEQFNLN